MNIFVINFIDIVHAKKALFALVLRSFFLHKY